MMKKLPQRSGNSRMREGLTLASMIAPFFHLYTKDDGPPSTSCMAMAPFLEDLRQLPLGAGKN